MNYKHTNWLFDEVMPQVKGNAFKIICVVVRRTWGWNKNADAISISQFMNLLGTSSRSTVTDAINSALNSGFISRQKIGQQYIYRMQYYEELVQNPVQSASPKSGTVSHKTSPESGTTSPESGTVLVQNPVTQSKEINKNNNSPSFSTVFKAYENNIGQLTPIISDEIGCAVDDFGAATVVEAIVIATKANVRKWNYVNGILTRWHKDGKQDRNIVKVEQDGGVYV